jgi:large subunit ribosomal protein L10
VALSKQEKAVKIDQVCAMVAQAKAIVVAEYRGLDVESITRLRRQARGQGVQLRVLKNTLARRAVTGTPFGGLSDHLVGPLVYGMGPDPVAVAKVLSSFAKDNDKLVVKAGAMADFVMDDKAVKALATMPSREELLAKLMATMQAPAAQFVRTLNEVPARLVRTLAAVRDARQAA